MKLDISENILSIAPYIPGKPIESLEREYGITDSVKLASNENPLGPSPKAVDAVTRVLGGMHRYPDGSGYDLTRKISLMLGVSPAQVILGNGSDEIIGMLATALLRPGDEVILPKPAFLMYDIMVRCADARPLYVPLNAFAIDLDAMLSRISDKTRMIFITNPNNPTGKILLKEDVGRFLTKIPSKVVVVIDEAYIEFVRCDGCANSLDFFDGNRPIVGLRTFSKAYGLAGLRIGYGLMPKELADILHRVRQPFNTNLPAQVGACAALDDRDHLLQTIRLVHNELDFLYGELNRMGIRFFPTQTNFFLIDLKRNADDVFEKLLTKGVIVRPMSSYEYPEFIRVTVGRREENRRFLDALQSILCTGT